MLALPGQWEANIKRGPDQGNAAHPSGELGRSDPMSQKPAVRSVSSALVRTGVNFCHDDWQGFGSSLPGNR